MKFFKRKKTAQNTLDNRQNEFNSAINFEAMQSYMQEKMLQQSYKIIFFLGVCFVLSVLAIVMLLPLKKEIPYLIRVNELGETDIITVINEKQITVNEALVKSNVYKYVRLREGYYWETVNNDYKLLQLFSNNTEIDNVLKIFSPTSGKPFIYTNKMKIVPSIISIVLSKGGGKTNIATVRVKLNYVDVKSNLLTKYETLTVNLTYLYDFKKNLPEKYRVENPLGFTVTSYRSDKEL